MFWLSNRTTPCCTCTITSLSCWFSGIQMNIIVLFATWAISARVKNIFEIRVALLIFHHYIWQYWHIWFGRFITIGVLFKWRILFFLYERMQSSELDSENNSDVNFRSEPSICRLVIVCFTLTTFVMVILSKRINFGELLPFMSCVKVEFCFDSSVFNLDFLVTCKFSLVCSFKLVAGELSFNSVNISLSSSRFRLVLYFQFKRWIKIKIF